MHVFSRQTPLRIVLLFLVPLMLFLLSAGGLAAILFLFGVPLNELNFGKIQWHGYAISIRGFVWEFTVKTLSIIAILSFLYKSQKIRPADLGLVWSIGQEGWKQTLWLQTKILLILFIGLILILNVVYHFFQITPQYLTSIHLTGFNLLGPIDEEIVFRGVFCTLLVRHRFRWSHTILVVGLVFGLIHYFGAWRFSLYPLMAYLIWCTIVGWFLGWMFYKTRTLIMPIFWHYFVNFAPLVLLLWRNTTEKTFEFMIFLNN